MKIAIPKETRANETRVAAVPETVKKLTKLGAEVVVEKGAGGPASYTDAAFEEAGASLAEGFAATVEGAEIVLKILAPTAEEVGQLAKGQKVFATMMPFREPEIMQACAAGGIDAFAMEFMPRITRAQSMDVLS
ncbi:MAG: NAD(P)(+) transhydrogenase (Re/Si-specific) subunit alpha, partial [Pseudomonadota bacterium]